MQNSKKRVISIVAPAFNEAEGLLQFHDRLKKVMDSLNGYCWNIVYINDGSQDLTLNILESICRQHENVTVLDLSRNFGKEIAMTAGLDHAQGDAVIVIDTDLQDPPEIIPEFIKEWEMGSDVVYGTRSKRDSDTWLKKWTAGKFYSVIEKTATIKIPRDTGDFRLISRCAIDALLQLREHHRFMKGLFSWIGFNQKAVYYERESRNAGETKFNYWKLWNFAIEGITSFTSLPLRVATYIGLVIALLAFFYGTIILTKTILFGDPVRGYPSLMVTVLFLGGINLMFLGIIGEYIGRLFNEAKNRPLYFIKETIKSPELNKN